MMETAIFSQKWDLHFNSYKKVFLLGIGGGCDIISAYAVQFFCNFPQNTAIIYGNTKHEFDADLCRISENIARLPSTATNNSSISNARMQTSIDRSIPRGFDGCPYIVRCTKSSLRSLPYEISRLGFDLVIAVDTGGDSIVQDAISGHEGRDKEMLEMLKASPIPFLLFVLGPGCDGESTEAQILHAFGRLIEEKKFVGCQSMESLIPIFEKFAANLSENRTPNIIRNAFQNKLMVTSTEQMIVPRGITPGISKKWLTHCFAFRFFK